MYVPTIDALETARVVRSLCEDWSINFFWTLIGCEIAEKLAEHHGWEWKRVSTWGITGPKYRRLSFTSFFSTAAIVTFFIAVGFEFLAVQFSGTLDRLSDEEIGFEQRQTRIALTIAGRANRDAGSANERAAKLENDAAQAKLALARLTLPRHLNPEQRKSVVAVTKRFPGIRFINWASFDKESGDFLQELESALTEDDGWSCLNPKHANPAIFSGILIQYDSVDKDALSIAASALSKALVNAGIKAKTEINPNHEKMKGVLHLVVGEKPKS